MRLFNLLQQRNKFFYLFLSVLGLTNAIWSSALVLLINNKIAGTPLPFLDKYDWVVYSSLIVVSFIISRYFQSYMIKQTYDFGNELGLSIFNKLRFTNYEGFVKLGEDKVRTAMTDVTTLQRFPQSFIETFNAAIMALMGIGYLFFTNPVGAVIVSVILGLLAGIYYLRNIPVYRDLNTVRTLANVYQQNVNDLLKGFKEVKMDTQKSDILFNNFIVPNRNKVKDLTIKTLLRHMFNELMVHYVWYIIIGVTLFLLPFALSLETQANVNFLVTVLYLMGPVSIVVSEIREYTQMQVALERIDEFNEAIEAETFIKVGHGILDYFEEPFQSIRFENVEFEYFDAQKQKTFRLKPLNLTIRKGDLIFVSGGNGSGKSTFINLLTGLYTPQSGTIFFNNRKIDLSNYPSYRNQIAAIFTDNYLFTENYYGLDLSPQNARLVHLIEKMGLSEVITLENEKKQIRTTLSKGQQKRLALIYAILADKPIYVFDEWAAEQDPIFRAFFYEKIVPYLNQMGKTIIAVTHDDAYFDCCNRMIRFDFGEVASDTYFRPKKELFEIPIFNRKSHVKEDLFS